MRDTPVFDMIALGVSYTDMHDSVGEDYHLWTGELRARWYLGKDKKGWIGPSLQFGDAATGMGIDHNLGLLLEVGYSF